MESLQRALANLRAYRKDHGGISQADIADSAGVSEATVQRYLNPKCVIDNPNYNTIIAIASAQGMETADLSLNQAIVEQMDKQQLADLVLELRKINIEELNTNDAKWRERLEAEDRKHADEIRHLTDAHNDDMRSLTEAHNEEIRSLTKVHAEEKKRINDDSNAYCSRMQEMHNEQILAVHESYKVQMQQMREANANHTSMMLESHHQQVEHIQQTNAAQYQALQDIAQTQKDADEKSKAYLKSLVRFWRIFSIALLAALILLLVADILNPSRGWLQFIGSKINLSYHPYA